MSHIPTDRLMAVASKDAGLFTAEEFEHIKTCRDCFSQWKSFIYDHTETETGESGE